MTFFNYTVISHLKLNSKVYYLCTVKSIITEEVTQKYQLVYEEKFITKVLLHMFLLFCEIQ